MPFSHRTPWLNLLQLDCPLLTKASKGNNLAKRSHSTHLGGGKKTLVKIRQSCNTEHRKELNYVSRPKNLPSSLTEF